MIINEKAVLDLASWDGMWAFEAEMLGAGLSGGDLLVRSAIWSQVVPLLNVAATQLRDRLSGILYSHGGFDVVRHLGLLYSTCTTHFFRWL